MNKHKKAISTHLLTAILVFVLTIGLVNPFGFFEYGQMLKFRQVVGLLRSLYYEEFDKKILVEGASSGAAEAIGDPYTEYMNHEIADEFKKTIEGKFSGIGAYISKSPEGFIYVINTLENSPAMNAGINAGDKIMMIDGREVKNTFDASALLMGQPGTLVRLSIMKPENDQIQEIEVTRNNITLKNVSYKLIDDLAYLKISQFSVGSYEEFKRAIEEIESKDITKIIIDLRGNPGGTIESVIDILDLFIDQDKILVYTINKKGKRTDYKAKTKEKKKFNTVIMTNNQSASASEVFVGAMKDYKKATVIGEKTFGKGVVQEFREIFGKSALKVTVSKYFTPNGESIHEKGIEPDIYVKLEHPFNSQFLDEDDAQFKKAIEILRAIN